MKKFALTLAASVSIGLGGSLIAAAPSQAATLPTSQPTVAVASVAAKAAPKPKPRVVIPTASVATKPSKWTGKRLVHPRGSAFPKKVLRWANLVSAVMAEHGIKKKRLSGILAQIQQESGGRKNAINNWDSNAKAGMPSMGLLQVIAPTYKYYAKPGLRSLKYQRVPYANIWAALNYVKSRYGMSKFKSWSSGYNQGY